jgi:hypothetical protein
MAAKPENTFRQGVHKYLPSELHHEKMCNPYSSGTPDDWYSGNRGDLWVEYKYLPKVPLRAEVVPEKLLSPLQLRWLNGRYTEGRLVAVVIGCPEGGVILRDQEWMHSYTAQMFRDRLVPRRDIAQWITQTTTR